MVKKQTYVTIQNIILKSDQRTAHLPSDTQEVDFVMKVKGRLTHDATMGDHVSILTETNRLVEGTLIDVNPSYQHSFGDYVDEVKKMKDIILSEMEDVS